jgi:hypothetical protein
MALGLSHWTSVETVCEDGWPASSLGVRSSGWYLEGLNRNCVSEGLDGDGATEDEAGDIDVVERKSHSIA